MKFKTIAIILVAITFIAAGCASQSDESTNNGGESNITTENGEYQLEIMSITQVDNESLLYTVKNVGNGTAKDVYFAFIGVKYHPSVENFMEYMKQNPGEFEDIKRDIVIKSLNEGNTTVNTNLPLENMDNLTVTAELLNRTYVGDIKPEENKSTKVGVMGNKYDLPVRVAYTKGNIEDVVIK